MTDEPIRYGWQSEFAEFGETPPNVIRERLSAFATRTVEKVKSYPKTDCTPAAHSRPRAAAIGPSVPQPT